MFNQVCNLLLITTLLLGMSPIAWTPQPAAASTLTTSEVAAPIAQPTPTASALGPDDRTVKLEVTPEPVIIVDNATPKRSGVVGETKDANEPAIYLIRLADAPLSSYRGGIAGLAATSPVATGARGLDIHSPAVIAYTTYLADKREDFLDVSQKALGRRVEAVYEYYAANNGLAVELTSDEAAKVAELPGVVSVQRDFERELHTDNGPAWIGAPTLWDGSSVPGGVGTMGEGVVVAVIDTGINYSNPSFAAVGPVDGYVHANPLGAGNFLGDCAPGGDFTTYCNDKLIGVHGYPSINGGDPVDSDGHGSHTASIAAGNFVTATLVAPTTIITRPISGVAPHANVIAYAACCTGAALSAAIDDIVVDYAAILAVDPNAKMAVNYSIGSSSPSSAWSDFDSVGYLNAREAGIFVATSAGNDGPGDDTLGSPADAPWLISVGSVTHNRRFANELVDMSGGDTPPPADMLGVGVTAGYGPAAIVYAGNYTSTIANDALCLNPFPAGTFSGQIVVCDRGTNARVDKGQNVLDGGAGGMVMADDGGGLVSDAHYLPAIHISQSDGTVLKTWLATGTGHQATIGGVYLDIADANGDIMAGTSSRGANRALPDIIGPSVVAPGVAVLAAYGTDNAIEWNVNSGTSMAGPHVAGSGALLMALHPDWTPAEMQSALMATAWQEVLKEDGVTPADPFAMGSGRVDLSVAAMAGLVLDESIANYWAADPSAGGDPKTLNLASMGNAQCVFECDWERTLRSTLDDTITWTASVSTPVGFNLSVDPISFTLSSDGEMQAISVTAEVSALPVDVWAFADVILTPDDPAIPAMHLPVAVKPTPGLLPQLVEVNTRRNAGSQWIEDLLAIEITDLTVENVGLTQADMTNILLDQDPTNGDPYDDLSQVSLTFVTVPAGARRLVAEVTASEAPDVDLFVLYNTGGTDYAQVCSSATGSWNEYCNIDDPVAGNYLVVVQNWQGSADQPDAIVLATAVVPDSDAGNMVIDGPGSVPERTLFDLQLFWDIPTMVAGDRWYGAFSLGTDAGNPGNIGVVPVNIIRHDDDVVKEASPVGAFPGDVVTYTLTVQPNVTPADLAYVLTDTIPAGLTYVVSSGSASSGVFDDSAAPTLTWTGVVMTMPVAITYQAAVDEPAVASPLTNVVCSLTDNDGDMEVCGGADLYILGGALKDVSATLINPGEQVTYTIVLTAGPGVTMWDLFDPLPAGLSLVSVDGATYDAGAHSIAWSGGLGTGGLTVLQEGFEDAAFPPAGWSLFETGAVDDPGWEQSSAANNVAPYTGDRAAYHDDADTTGDSDAWLVTPRITVPADDAFSFWQADYFQTYYYYHGVWVTTDADPDPNVAAYTELYSGDVTATWVEEGIDLSAYAGQDIYLAFRYQGDFEDEWYIDDVLLEGTVDNPAHTITVVMEGVLPGYYTNVAHVDVMGFQFMLEAPELHVSGPIPTWEKEVWINGDGPALPGTHGVVPGDMVTIVDHVSVESGDPITFTLLEAWDALLSLQTFDADFGDVMADTAALTWTVEGGVADTWLTLTKTFEVLAGSGWDGMITETLDVVGYPLTLETPVAFRILALFGEDGPATADTGESITYTLTIELPDPLLTGGAMALTDTLPAGVAYAGNVTATYGSAWYDAGDNAVYWNGTVMPPGQVVMLEEGFEDGTMPPPDGWSVIDSAASRHWEVVDTGDDPDWIHSGAYAGWVNYVAEDQDEWLLSPLVDLTGMQGYMAEFWVYANNNWVTFAELQFLVIDGGGTFTDTLWEQSDETWPYPSAYYQVQVDLSAYADQSVYLAWRYVGNDGDSVALDDIRLLGEVSSPSSITVAFNALITAASGVITNVAQLTYQDKMLEAVTVLAVNEYLLAVDVVGNGTVGQDPQPPYGYGDMVTLTATADPGWTFMGWSGDATGVDEVLTVTIMGDAAITATFTQDEYTLDVVVDPLAGGAVAIDPQQTTYFYGDVVTLTATANLDWTFVGWSGDATGADEVLVVTIMGNTAVTATFTQEETYTLDVVVDPAEGGAVDVNPLQAAYLSGEVVTLTATANSGWDFAGWSGGATSVDEVVAITITDDTVVTATFTEAESYTLDVVVDPLAGGAVTVDPERPTYFYGDVVTLTAAANLDWTFVGWSGDATGADEVLVVTIMGNTAVTATFTQEETYTLDVVVDPAEGGAVDVNPLQAAYLSGEVVTLTATANSGWDFAGWSGGATGVNEVVAVTIAGDTVVTATFAPEGACVSVNNVALELLTTGAIYTNTMAQFSATIAPATAVPYTYTIDYGAGAGAPVQTSTNPLTFNHTFATTGTMTVTVAAWNCAMTVPVTATVQVEVSSGGLMGYTIYLPLIQHNDQ